MPDSTDPAGLILIGMPGIAKRLARYPQLYSRIGFAHHYRPLGKDELTFVLTQHWRKLGLELDTADFSDAQAIAAIARIASGNFRLIQRLFVQILPQGSDGRPYSRPAGRAGLPPGTAGIHPPLRPSRQVARRGGGPGTRPPATRRYGPVPARPGGDGPRGGPPAGRVQQRGHGGAHHEGARHRRVSARFRRAARYGRARPGAARYGG